VTSHVPNEARVIPLRPQVARPGARPVTSPPAPEGRPPVVREPLWRDLVGDVLRRERLAQERTLKEVAEAARISMPYLSEVERGRKEASSEVLAAAAGALGLGLGDLLARAQGELLRLTSRHTVTSGHTAGRGSGAPGARFDGMCLAA
jgi:transcriptional regulator with XRE-family HTH domain